VPSRPVGRPSSARQVSPTHRMPLPDGLFMSAPVSRAEQHYLTDLHLGCTGKQHMSKRRSRLHSSKMPVTASNCCYVAAVGIHTRWVTWMNHPVSPPAKLEEQERSSSTEGGYAVSVPAAS
jgi:hypothetical protein